MSIPSPSVTQQMRCEMCSLEVDTFQQQIEANNEQRNKQNPQFIAIPTGSLIPLRPLHTLLGAGTEQVTRFVFLGLAVHDGGVTKFDAPLVTSLLLGIVVARVIAELAGFAPQGLTYSKHIFLPIRLYFYGWLVEATHKNTLFYPKKLRILSKMFSSPRWDSVFLKLG